MAKISLSGFRDPIRRPRYIIWTGVFVLVLAAVVIVALGVTSTRWFCAQGCHKVQDDTIIAYTRSSHSEVSCMACHMPVNANPVVFLLHKAEALGELYLTVTNGFELPLNAESEVALTMASRQCTQCHNLKNRAVTPSRGIKIDHEAHAKINAACPVCHNRIAHREDFELTLKDPKTGEPNRKHVDFMSMTACFRCHGLEKGAAAPGACSACHPAGFDLKPASHKEKTFYPKGHAEMAKEMLAESQAASHGKEGAESGGEAEGSGEGGSAEPEQEEGHEKDGSFLGPEKAYASSGGSGKEPVAKEDVPQVIAAQRKYGARDDESIGEELPKVESIFYCSTCHTQQFCLNCHGMEMPHPAEFKEPKDRKDPAGHPAVSKAKPEKCQMCHGKTTVFCDTCHHGTKVGWTYDPKVPWTQKQHPKAVAKAGVTSCTSCHAVKFCVDCHTGRKVVPSSHKQANWTRPKFPGALTVFGQRPAQPSARHTKAAEQSIESCQVCHGENGIKAPFCRGCHKVELPHAPEFKTNHVSSKKNPKPCVQCHQWRELCSNCHHIGSSFTRPWIAVHGASTNKNTPAGCIEKCHEKKDCVSCHQRRKVVPASHKANKFVRDFSEKSAGHVALYKKDGEICTYCHVGAAAELPNSKFCRGCHKLEMPHKINEGEKQRFLHKEGFAKKQLKKAQCANCHRTAFCDACHHEGSVANRPWIRYHPNVVKKTGAQPCFDCHEPTFCANCHVNLAKRGLLR